MTTGFDIQVIHGADELGQEVWDRLSAGRPFTSYRWYRFGEAVLSDCLPLYIILSQSGEPTARATFWLKKREVLSLTSPFLQAGVSFLLQHRPLLICESPFAGVSGLVLPSAAKQRASALDLIAQAALEAGRTYQASFILWNYLEQAEASQSGWRPEFVTMSFSDPGTHLTLVWNSFETYLSHLSYKTRKNYRRYCRAAERQGIEIRRYATVPYGVAERAHELIRNVERKHGASPTPWLSPLLDHAPMVDGIWLAAEQQGHLVGCELMLRDGEAWLVTLPGLDYTATNIYSLLGCTDIACAIESGAKTLRWGSGLFETKKRWGFELEDNYHQIYTGSGRLVEWLGQWLAKWAD